VRVTRLRHNTTNALVYGQHLLTYDAHGTENDLFVSLAAINSCEIVVVRDYISRLHRVGHNNESSDPTRKKQKSEAMRKSLEELSGESRT
jgi:hypothetical protein